MKIKTVIILAFICFRLFPANAQEVLSTFIYDMADFTITLLSEVQRPGNGDVLVGATPEMLEKYLPEGTYPSAVNAFLVETPGKTILVDAGYGTRLFDNLKEIGRTPEEIDLILLTHMHGDHIGGLLQENQKSFPNAQLYISQAEHDYWTHPTNRESQPENRRRGFDNAQKVIEVYQDQLVLFEPGQAGGTIHEIMPGVHSIAAYGHTPGHTGYLFESEERKIFIWGDLVNAMAIQIPHPEIATIHDMDPLPAARTRGELLEYLVKNKIRVAGMHIEFPGMGDLIGNQADGCRFILLCPCEGR
ncbi:MAG: MBL fold metallo-hydrolase [Tannerellaceae bacterium]|nr:MBL fold metallo-hydrolase [Tannerellaceae bacterium]